jgi:DNA repair exonuclease SbcCD ATPase subunit
VNIKLMLLRLTNFKGFRSYTLEPGGLDEAIYGDNETGKTTLFDAFTWLLFGKDSLGRSDFGIKTLDTDGNPIPNIDHSVEAVLEIDGRLRTFTRTYREKYTKKKGTKEAELTGHETLYVIDDMPMKEMEYQGAIRSIMDEGVFKLLTSARWFNEQLSWQERRKVIMATKQVTWEAILAADANLAELPALVQPDGRVHAQDLQCCVDDWRKAAATRKADINKEMNALPVRIDEATKATPPDLGHNVEEVKAKLEEARAFQKEKQQERATIEAGGAVATKLVELRQVEGAIIQEENLARADAGREAVTIRQERERVLGKLAEVGGQVQGMTRQTAENGARRGRILPALQAAREAWQKENAAVWVWDGEDTCPTCGQLLPENQVEAARHKAEESFNLAKSAKLEALLSTGTSLRKELEELDAHDASLTKDITEKREQMASLNTEADFLKERLEGLVATERPVVSPRLIELKASKARIEEEIAAMREGNAAARANIDEALKNVEGRMNTLLTILSGIDQHNAMKARVEDLRDRQKTLGKQYDAIERGLWLTELFIRTKVKLLEEAINGQFKLVRFKLFDIQVNGALVETCEVTIKGVPYSDLNNAGRINAGLDVINTLAAYYQKAAPVFVDNAEAVTRLMPTTGQQIRLYVSEPDKELRVVHPQKGGASG